VRSTALAACQEGRTASGTLATAGAARRSAATAATRATMASAIDLLKEAAGETDLSRVTDLEIIFTETELFLDALGQLPNLRRLTLIDTRMRTLVNLRQVGATLHSLTLTKQGLERMENLSALPNLVELFLQHNAIKRIEGLQGCRKLRRLWLCENRIQAIEGLENLGDLRELCVQGNRIARLDGLNNSANLRKLDVSRNSITRLTELDSLVRLAQLRELALQSDTFGACPVVFQENYRAYAVCALPQIAWLDGAEVHGDDRAAAEDNFVQRALEFNDRVEELHRSHREELRAIELGRMKSVREADDIKEQLLAQFVKLQDVVVAGREKVRREHARQLRIREQNLDRLKLQLNELKTQHSKILDDLEHAEQDALAEDEQIFTSVSRRARLELQEAVAMAELSSADRGDRAVAFQVLCSEGTSSAAMPSELKALCLSLERSQEPRDDAEPPLLVNRASKVFSRHLYDDHVATVSQDTKRGKDTAHPNKPGWARDNIPPLYIALPDLEALKLALLGGLGELAESGALTLCSDPRSAVRLRGTGGSSDAKCRVLQCRANFHRVHFAERVPQLASLKSASSHLRTMPTDCQAVRLADGTYIVETAKASLVLPVIYAILARPVEPHLAPPDRAVGSVRLSREPALDQVVASVADKIGSLGGAAVGITPEVDAKLSEIEQIMDTCLQRYSERLQHELDPAMADKVDELERSVATAERALLSARDSIDKGKARQEQILRDFHSAM